MSSKKKRRRKPTRPAKPKRRLPVGGLLIAAGCCAAVIVCAAAAVALLRAGGMLPVASAAGHTVSQAELQYYYVEEIADYQDQISRYGSDYELNIDFTQPLSQQNCPLTSGISWHTYFVEKALEEIEWEIAAQERALAEGFALSDAEEEALALLQADREVVAAEAGMTEEEYLLARYGDQVTGDQADQWERRRMLSTCYMAARLEQYEPSEEEIETWFQSNRRWNMEADYWSVPLASAADEQETVLAALEGTLDIQDFLGRCEAYADGDAVEHAGASAEDMKDYTVAEWLLEEDRQAGDVTVVESYDETSGQSSLIALYFLDARREEEASCVFREMLLMPEAVAPGDSTRYWGAQGPDAWTGLDETSFSACAMAFSTLSSGSRGGERAAGPEEIASQPYGEWLLDPERAPGDAETFETGYGTYVVRYEGRGAACWEAGARESLASQWESALTEEIVQAAPLETSLFYFLFD